MFNLHHVRTDESFVLRNRTDRDGGFSLVEMLIVVVVIGVLSTVVVFAVRSITDRGQESACSGDARTLEIAAGGYLVQNQVDEIPATGTADGDEYERTLVDAGLINAVSSYYTLDADGSVTADDVVCT